MDSNALQPLASATHLLHSCRPFNTDVASRVESSLGRALQGTWHLGGLPFDSPDRTWALTFPNVQLSSCIWICESVQP